MKKHVSLNLPIETQHSDDPNLAHLLAMHLSAGLRAPPVPWDDISDHLVCKCISLYSSVSGGLYGYCLSCYSWQCCNSHRGYYCSTSILTLPLEILGSLEACFTRHASRNCLAPGCSSYLFLDLIFNSESTKLPRLPS